MGQLEFRPRWPRRIGYHEEKKAVSERMTVY